MVVGLHGGTWKRTYKNRNKKTKIETNIATMIETNRKRQMCEKTRIESYNERNRRTKIETKVQKWKHKHNNKERDRNVIEPYR